MPLQRTKIDEESINKYPNHYAKGLLKGIEIFEKACSYPYLDKVMDRSLYRWVDKQRGYAYRCGLYEGYTEEEANNIKTNVIIPQEDVKQ